MSQPKSPSLFPVLLVNFIGMLGYSLIIPILVFLVQKFGGNAFVYGILGATYPAFQLFGAPLLGRWSDRIGRRKVLLVSQIGTFVAWCLFIISLLLPVQGPGGKEQQQRNADGKRAERSAVDPNQLLHGQ
ncbi:MAG: MFS transporter, partial [Bacteroidota bacterium]